MNNHIDWINQYIKSNNIKSFLMIGVDEPSKSIDRIVCETKIGVDPYLEYNGSHGWVKSANQSDVLVVTSDEFFKTNKAKFDCIFIDGDHSMQQAFKDVKNAHKALNDNGVMLIHDVWPTTESHVLEAPETPTAEWMGGVFRVWHALDMFNNNELVIDPRFYGIGELKKAHKIPRGLGESAKLTLSDYIQYRGGK